MNFIANRQGSKGVVELEKLARSMYVTLEMGNAEALTGLQTHISLSAAIEAVQEYDSIANDAKLLTGAMK